MRAAYYERNGTAREVLKSAKSRRRRPGAGEVRVKLATSGVNPSDVKSRQGSTRKIAFPRVIPHSDGAGVIDEVGDGVAKSRIGERVWVWNGQWKRAFRHGRRVYRGACRAGGDTAGQCRVSKPAPVLEFRR